jgi:HEAT repeat protein
VTLADQLRAPALDERLAAIEQVSASGAAGPETLQVLAECLADSRKLAQRRAAEAFAVLAGQDTAVRPILTTALQSDSARQRWGAAYALSLIGPAPVEALPALLDALGAGDGDQRWAAADIMVRMGAQPQVINALLSSLHSGPALQRKMAAYCLRDLNAGSPEGQQALFAGLDDGDIGVQLACMSALARLSSDRSRVAERLRAFVIGADERLCRAAAATLGALGERSQLVLDTLHAACSSPDLSLRRAAERSLRLLHKY